MGKFDLSKINSLDGFDFENLIAKLMVALGYEVDQTKKTGDGGIDIIAHTDKPIIAGKYLIQCKRHKSPIGEPFIRDLYGVMMAEHANKGILITNSNFSPNAVTFAKGKPIELIDGTMLFNLLTEHLTDEDVVKTILFSPYQRKIAHMFIETIGKYEKKYNEVKNGMIFNKPKEIADLYKQFLFIVDRFSDQTEMLSILFNILSRLECVMAENVDSINQDSVNDLFKNMDSIINELFKRFQAVYSLQAANEFKYFKKLFLEFSDFIFDTLVNWKRLAENAISNPETLAKDGKITLVLTLASDDRLMKFTECIEEEGKALLKVLNPPPRESYCFISTACYGCNSIEVNTFKAYRDIYLLKSFWGTLFIKIYYFVSPPIAGLIENNLLIKKVSRVLLFKIYNKIRAKMQNKDM